MDGLVQPCVARRLKKKRCTSTLHPLQDRLRAFTLIELLVVIAIIAILAAILFPVFAQAKRAAKATASLSNVKQIALSFGLYSSDFDDYFPIGGQWHSPDIDASKGYANSWYMPWTGLTLPYRSSLDLTNSPFVGQMPVPYLGSNATWMTCSTRRQCALLFPTYGYNIAYLSPTPKVLGGRMEGLPQTSVERPAEQVMLTETWYPPNTTWRVQIPPEDFGYVSFGSAEPPDGGVVQAVATTPYAATGWGIEFQRKKALSFEEGSETAGVAFRSARRTPTAFADGHVKLLSPEQLAIGTNWVAGVTEYGDVQRYANGKYLWDPRGL